MLEKVDFEEDEQSELDGTHQADYGPAVLRFQARLEIVPVGEHQECEGGNC